MSALPKSLLDEVTAVLALADRQDLVRKLKAHQPTTKALTSGQAAKLLGVSSANTVKNWLEGGQFPGAFQTPGGHWRFPREEVVALKARMDLLNNKNARGDLTPPDEGDGEYPEPPLL